VVEASEASGFPRQPRLQVSSPTMTLILLASALVLASVTIVSPLAGAFEMAGDMRLERGRYVSVRGVYYPGFTIAGLAEPLAIFVLVFLLASLLPAGLPFCLVALALAAEALAHLLYWILIAPMNRIWLADDTVAAETDGQGVLAGLRDRWELSHVYRLLASTLAFVFLVAATLAGSASL
jgi:hypothetical protein